MTRRYYLHAVRTRGRLVNIWLDGVALSPHQERMMKRTELIINRYNSRAAHRQQESFNVLRGEMKDIRRTLETAIADARSRKEAE